MGRDVHSSAKGCDENERNWSTSAQDTRYTNTLRSPACASGRDTGIFESCHREKSESSFHPRCSLPRVKGFQCNNQVGGENCQQPKCKGCGKFRKQSICHGWSSAVAKTKPAVSCQNREWLQFCPGCTST